ncbi:helix-turn-helix transcriptional regulator [Roseomonas mucosa]
MNEDLVITTENVDLLPPERPGKMLQQWFNRQSDPVKQDFVKNSGLNEDTLKRLYQGQEKINSDVARRLSVVFGKEEAEFWFWMQSAYDHYQETGQQIDRSSLRPLFE